MTHKPTLLLFLLIMLQLVHSTHRIKRPDYARDTGLPNEILTKYEKSGWLYRQLMEKDPYYAIPPRFLSEAKKEDALFGKKSGWVNPDVLAEKNARSSMSHQTRIRLSQPQQAMWASYRNPAMVAKKTMTKEEYAKKFFEANPYLQYFTGGNPMDPHIAARSIEQGKRLGPNLDDLKARRPDVPTRVVKPLARDFQPPKPWETYDTFRKRTIPKRLGPLPFLDKANARREAANKVFGQNNPPGFVHWPQAAPKYLRNAEKYAIGNQAHLNILENEGVRAAINSDNPAFVDATFSNYHQLEQMMPRRTSWEKNEMMKQSQRVSEAFKWERIKDKVKNTNSHVLAQLKSANKYLPSELKKQHRYIMKELNHKQSRYGRYNWNEKHAEKNLLFRRERVPSHPVAAAWLSSALFANGMEGHWPHIDDKNYRHYGIPSPYAGGFYDPIQSTYNRNGPFRNWQPNKLSSKCIGLSEEQAKSAGCFVNSEWGAGWGMFPMQHSLSHPAEYQVQNGMQFSQDPHDNLRRKWIRTGTYKHSLEHDAKNEWKLDEEYQYPARYSAFRAEAFPQRRFETQAMKDFQAAVIQEAKDKHDPSIIERSKEENPGAWFPRSSTYTNLTQATAPRGKNWNLQYVQDHNFPRPKSLGVFIVNNKDPKKSVKPFFEPPANLQYSPDEPVYETNRRDPDPNNLGPMKNPMAGLVFEEEQDMTDERDTYQKTYGSDPRGLHNAEPGIPDIIMYGQVNCYRSVPVDDAQISLYADGEHITSAFTDEAGKFKLETTLEANPKILKLEIFHQCKESPEEKLEGKGETGVKKVDLKAGDRRVYNFRKIDTTDSSWNWRRDQRPLEGIEYQGDKLVGLGARLRPCLYGDPGRCDEEIKSDYFGGKSDLEQDAGLVPGVNLKGGDRDEAKFEPERVRH